MRGENQGEQNKAAQELSSHCSNLPRQELTVLQKELEEREVEEDTSSGAKGDLPRT
jgi:hypothetical protein